MPSIGPLVRIEALAFGGDGVGRLPGGKAVFVGGSAPGDEVRVRLLEEKPSVAFGEIEALVTAAPERVAPRCPVADRCGGCTWQHLPVDVQRAWKHRLIERELTRRGLGGDGVPGAMACGPEFGHRTRTRLHRRGVDLGTLPRRSHRVIPLQACPILAPELEAFALALAVHLRAAPPFDAEVELYVDADGRRGMSVEPAGRPPLGFWDQVAGELGVTALRVKGARPEGVRGREVLTEVSGSRRLGFEPGVFVQTTRVGNALLVAEALGMAGEGATFAEVYAGIGNFTVHLAERYGRGSASEGSRTSAAWLGRNLAGSPSVSTHAEQDDASARRLTSGAPVDLLLADPPRAGMKPLEPLFERVPPRRVVMVSCHPMAAVRDLERLAQRGYRLERLTPIDLFPQTDHLEVAASLVLGR